MSARKKSDSALRICILGNSHAACLKEGWDRMANKYPHLQLTFFAARRDLLKGLHRTGNVLLPDTPGLARNLAFTSNGEEQVDLENYDIFLLQGLGLHLPGLDSRLSQAVLRQTHRDILHRSLSLALCKLIREASEAPIYLGHNPQKAGQMANPQRLPYRAAWALMQAELPAASAVLLEQPAETLVNDWHTRNELSRGSTRLDVGDRISGAPHDDEDNEHMNADFGCIFLEHFFKLLKTKRAPG